ncbi:MAG TPA: ATPase domain-containing protein [Candidatus Deferrimicrobium sp.]|nr:ATPase domain-containing protein [Candidatus Deferrimicrobium sp.]
MEIDDIDRQILQVLEEDPRISNKKISQIVGLTPQAVGIRIKKLKDARIIGGIKISPYVAASSKRVREIDRFSTNIEGFDKYIGGGFPNPSTILLLGESGVGTTVFCLKLLWTALNAGLNCAYFSIERPLEQVLQQLKSFGWDPSQSENIKFVDVFKIINQHINEFESMPHIDLLQIYREMIEQRKNLMPHVDIIFYDSFTELIKLTKGNQYEGALINQLGINIMKQKGDQICFYVFKPHMLTQDSLLTLKSYADGIIQFRKEVQDSQINRYLLIEKVIFTAHHLMEIKFHITNQGIILNENYLKYLARQNPPSSESAALFNVTELDYLTQGLRYGTTWILEVDSIFSSHDLFKLYIDFILDGLSRQEACMVGIPRHITRSEILGYLNQSIKNNKAFRKSDLKLEEIVTQNQLVLYDIFQKEQKKEDKDDQSHQNYFRSVSWSSEGDKNLTRFAELIDGVAQQNSNHIHFGFNISDLLDFPLQEAHIIKIYEMLVKLVQRRGDILLSTLNPSLFHPSVVSKLEYYSDGIIQLGVNAGTKFIQILKNPNGNPSAMHQIRFHEEPPYIQII